MYLAQAALPVRPQPRVANEGLGCRSGRDVRLPGIDLALRHGPDAAEACLHIGVADLPEFTPGAPGRIERRQASLCVVAVDLHVLAHHHIDHVVEIRRHRALLNENLSQRAMLLQHPGVHALQQSVARDEVDLQCQNAEQQVHVGKWSGHGHLESGFMGTTGMVPNRCEAGNKRRGGCERLHRNLTRNLS